MSRQIVFTPNAAKPPATYSQAVKAAGLVFVSGTAPQDLETGAITGARSKVKSSLTPISLTPPPVRLPPAVPPSFAVS